MSEPDLQFRDEATSSRFELHVNGERVSLADYRIDRDVVTIPHVETAPAHRGNGYAEQLMDGVVESLRANGQTLRPLCPFAADYIHAHPETHDLVAR
ncbi:GNAT family N-acetyltransferase [Ilumatobacter nonamiensis]|uniref:GNAT family N-acetyltransferase n=1 Tax=Ilumatobacter nonamiensis TaxID=467093 RepID=UPI000348230B|nr:GNAT family N-acetyltransferase [Ilumatobacter nonamiensis]